MAFGFGEILDDMTKRVIKYSTPFKYAWYELNNIPISIKHKSSFFKFFKLQKNIIGFF